MFKPKEPKVRPPQKEDEPVEEERELSEEELDQVAGGDPGDPPDTD